MPAPSDWDGRETEWALMADSGLSAFGPLRGKADAAGTLLGSV